MTTLKDKREAILQAMLELVAERGFHDAPMSVVAKRAGASAGIIYHYFPSKDELIRALYFHVKAKMSRFLIEGHVAGMSAEQAFKQVWINAYRFYRTHQQEMKFLDQYESSPYCVTYSEAELLASQDQNFVVLMKLFRQKSAGGPLNNLPLEVLGDLSIGVAARLARREKALKKDVLEKAAAACWRAVT
ncbi:TetR/AcrR family transcriptional regulator [Granulicella sp. S156]|jgi:AcrR family transcriptional regulator|uniref:TetR/AcrR family transcriptional regulator n=1 Tax=Granulicella sp. S156 TaxID=1747224 RepID=UPI00131DD8E3|nr:TetR/AcrR family transcriptional regulator [Granulicella sp. S156]